MIGRVLRLVGGLLWLGGGVVICERERLGQLRNTCLSGFEVINGGAEFLLGIFVLLLHCLLADGGGIFSDVQGEDLRVG